MVQTLDRINWFQGWIIIIMLFTGIAMLKHYEDRGAAQAEAYQKQAIQEQQAILANLAELQKRVDRNQLLLSESKCLVGTIDTWAASVEPNP